MAAAWSGWSSAKPSGTKKILSPFRSIALWSTRIGFAPRKSISRTSSATLSEACAWAPDPMVSFPCVVNVATPPPAASTALTCDPDSRVIASVADRVTTGASREVPGFRTTVAVEFLGVAESMVPRRISCSPLPDNAEESTTSVPLN